MKNTYKYILIAACSLASVVSCARIEEQEAPEIAQKVRMTFTAQIEGDADTKTVLGGQMGDEYRKVLWQPGDSVGVVNSLWYNYMDKFINIEADNSEIATFEGSTADGSTFYMFYPYSNNLYAREDDKIDFTIPSSQTYAKESFTSNAMPMVAKGRPSETLQFYSLCGVLAINMTGTETVQSISFTGKDADGNPIPVAGDYYVNMVYEDAPEIYIRNSNNTATVTLGCGDGVVLDPVESTPFYLVLPPATYESFSIIIATTDGKVMLKESVKPLTIRRTNVTKTGALTYVANETINLSTIGTANSYIVSESGLYSIDATVIGNGDFGIVDGAHFHTTNTTISPKSAKLLWEDKSGVIGGVTFADGKISFLSTGTKGNALIAATDDNDNILWSWHIWVTEQPAEHEYVNTSGTYTMLDRNLGAIRADRGSNDDEWKDSYGLQYQWGRKDPFAHDRYTTLESQVKLNETVSSPTRFIVGNSRWTSEWDRNFWSPVQKTIYDPCPAGYRVPDTYVWSVLSLTGEDTNKPSEMNLKEEAYDKGWYFYYNDTDYAWYPATPVIGYWGDVDNYDGNSFLWTSYNEGGSSSKRLFFYFNSEFDCGLYINDSWGDAVTGHSVRCMKDERVNAVSVRMREVNDVTATTAKAMANVAVMGDIEVQRSGFIYGTESTLTLDKGIVIDCENILGEISVTMEDLAQYTKYYVKAFTVATDGTVYYSPGTMSFVTPTVDGKMNLTAEGTANSYMLPPMAMEYTFNATVIGNGQFGIVEGGNFHTSDPAIAPTDAELLWSDREGLIVKDSVAFDGTNISFATTGLEGNAMIAAKDAKGRIVWSWHIWITDIPDDLRYENDLGIFDVQDRNLGAVSAERGFGEQWKESAGLDFQWGRKDPFAGGFMHETNNQYYLISDFIRYPNVWASEWERGESYWKPDMKTIYDPCPIGYRVASDDVWNGFSTERTSGSFENGWYVKYNEAGDLTWYPNRAKAYDWGVDYWSEGSILSSTYGGGLSYHSWNIYRNNVTTGNLRCMKDENATSVTVRIQSVSDVTSSTSVIVASVAAQGDIAVERSGIVYGTSPSVTLESGTSVDVDVVSGSFTATLEGLAPLKKYYVKAFAVATDGNTYYSNKTMSFITPSEDGTIDLSVGGTANSYIVYPFEGTYVFDLVKGNSSESVGDVSTLEVLWETYNNQTEVLQGTIISSVSVENGKAKIELPENALAGNALVAAKDADGTILWSWHIWVADYDPEMTQQTYASGAIMMDRNLGATSVVPGSLESYGFFYQWGRKDPFPINGYMYTYPADAVTYEYYDSNNDTIENAYKNPTIVYDDSQWNWRSDLWGISKTIHDPCPAGWRVSERSAWENLYRADNSQYGYFQLSSASAMPTAYVPLPGYSEGDMNVYESGNRGHLWMAERQNMMYFWVWNSSPDDSWYDVDNLMGVRCMKDQSVGSGNNEDYTEGDDYVWE